MKKTVQVLGAVLLLVMPLLGQGKRLWVLQPPGEMVEYDPASFAVKGKVQLPPGALKSPDSIRINHVGQILYATLVPLPLAEENAASVTKVWLWNGHSATTIDSGITREVSVTGSNQAITEVAPVPFLSADGRHLFWFANRARRLERENIDLSTATTWQAWRTDLQGGGREELASTKFSDCRCETGTCEETCPHGEFWAPESGVDKFFLMTEFVAGQTESDFKATTRFLEQDGKWLANALPEPVQRPLDAFPNGDIIVEAIPDSGCCGWSNESNDQTLLLTAGKKRIVFDERAQYQNPDYDVSFYTPTALLSPDLASVAMTIVSTGDVNKPIQLADQGQANPEESLRIRKALTELPVVEVKSMDDCLGAWLTFRTPCWLVG